MLLQQMIEKKKQEANYEINHFFQANAIVKGYDSIEWGNDEKWSPDVASFGIAYDEALVALFQAENIEASVSFERICSLLHSGKEIPSALELTENGVTYTVDLWYGDLDVPGQGATTDVWIDFRSLKESVNV